jgi:hypothetical protein
MGNQPAHADSQGSQRTVFGFGCVCLVVNQWEHFAAAVLNSHDTKAASRSVPTRSAANIRPLITIAQKYHGTVSAKLPGNEPCSIRPNPVERAGRFDRQPALGRQGGYALHREWLLWKTKGPEHFCSGLSIRLLAALDS